MGECEALAKHLAHEKRLADAAPPVYRDEFRAPGSHGFTERPHLIVPSDECF